VADGDRRREMRRHLVVMLVLVAVVDAVAIAAWFLAGLRGRSGGVQVLFTIVWTVATLAVVVVSMRKIREAQRR
jgi:FtsH-binding integral membrane protein